MKLMKHFNVLPILLIIYIGDLKAMGLRYILHYVITFTSIYDTFQSTCKNTFWSIELTFYHVIIFGIYAHCFLR